MGTKFTPLFMQDQREKAQAAKVEEVPYSWEFRTVGARELPNRAIYAADAANFYPAALDEIERLRGIMADNDLIECPKCGYWSPSTHICESCGYDHTAEEEEGEEA